jgi:hypothetical protein
VLFKDWPELSLKPFFHFVISLGYCGLRPIKLESQRLEWNAVYPAPLVEL